MVSTSSTSVNCLKQKCTVVGAVATGGLIALIPLEDGHVIDRDVADVSVTSNTLDYNLQY